jgi:hypothetical protein
LALNCRKLAERLLIVVSLRSWLRILLCVQNGVILERFSDWDADWIVIFADRLILKALVGSSLHNSNGRVIL